MRLGREASGLLEGFNPWKQFRWIVALSCLVSGCFAVSTVGFLRKDFGERYFGTINLLFGYTIVANFAFLGNFIGVAAGHRFSWLMVLFWAAFVAVSVYHRLEISRKNKNGEEWHSMNMGSSILPVPMSEEKIFKFVEPALVFVGGVILWKLSGPVGIWLMISGLSLFVNNHIVYFFQRQSLLDMRDASIEAKYIGDAVKGKPGKQTGGFVMAESNIQMIRKDAGLQKAFANLSKDMKNVFDADPDFGPVAA